jgi:hypothetical protein
VWDNKGRRPEWPLKRLDDLLSAVEQIKKKDRISTDHEALSRLRQRNEWPPPANYRGTNEQWLKTLKNRLAEARRLNRLAEAEARRFSKWIGPSGNPGN